MKNGIPIMLGYFAVSFALGIAAKNVGMDAIQAGYMSITMLASAGEFAALNLIASTAGVIEAILTCLVVNLRYFLMSCSLSQKLDPKMKLRHLFLLAHFVTDELFGISIVVDGYLNPFYTYGAALVSAFGWTVGTVLGVIVGNILPLRVANAMGVAMYGMFLAIVIPPAKKDKFLGLVVVISMAASFIFTKLPLLRDISSGFRIIILTVLIAGIAACIKPIRDDLEKGGAK